MSGNALRRSGAWIAAYGQIVLLHYSSGISPLSLLQSIPLLIKGIQIYLLFFSHTTSTSQNFLHTYIKANVAIPLVTLLGSALLAIIPALIAVLEIIVTLTLGLPLLFLLLALLGGLLTSGLNLISLPRLFRTTLTQYRARAKTTQVQKRTQSSGHAGYTFQSVWLYEQAITSKLFDNFQSLRYYWFDTANSILDWRIRWGGLGPASFWLWLLAWSFRLAGLVQILLAYEFCIFFSTLLSTFLLLWLLLLYTCIAAFFLGKTLSSSFYGIFLRCPICDQEMAVATYLCPNCHTEQAHLYPNQAGILFQHCNECGTKLPTLRVLGREKLRRQCAACHQPLDSDIGKGTNIHLALIGTPGTAKTTYLIHALHELTSLHSWHHHNLRCTFTSRTQEADIQASIKSSKMIAGQQKEVGSAKEAAAETQTYTIKIHEEQKRNPAILYCYDPNELAQSSMQGASQRSYYRYLHGLVLVIDPTQLIIPTTLSSTSSDTRASVQQAETALLIMQRYERSMQMLEITNGLYKWNNLSQVCAVIVMHADKQPFTHIFGDAALQAALTFNADQPLHYSEREAQHVLVRRFLSKQGLDHLVRDIEAQFRSVSYFACATDEPGQTLPTTSPLHPLHPLRWLLAQAKCLQ